MTAYSTPIIWNLAPETALTKSTPSTTTGVTAWAAVASTTVAAMADLNCAQWLVQQPADVSVSLIYLNHVCGQISKSAVFEMKRFGEDDTNITSDSLSKQTIQLK